MEDSYIKLLIKSAQQGKKNAYRELCNINLKKIYTMAVRFLLNEKVAEKITEEIFIEAWENLKFLREDQSFDLWLRSIAIYRLLDELRTLRIRNELIDANEITDANDGVFSENKCENIILTLPEKERIIFILHEIEKYTYEEIASFMNETSLEEIKSIIINTRRVIISAEDYE
jgi:RNA polymerase sigma-70 factor (ECF subfamily)